MYSPRKRSFDWVVLDIYFVIIGFKCYLRYYPIETEKGNNKLKFLEYSQLKKAKEPVHCSNLSHQT